MSRRAHPRRPRAPWAQRVNHTREPEIGQRGVASPHHPGRRAHRKKEGHHPGRMDTCKHDPEETESQDQPSGETPDRALLPSAAGSRELLRSQSRAAWMGGSWTHRAPDAPAQASNEAARATTSPTRPEASRPREADSVGLPCLAHSRADPCLRSPHTLIANEHRPSLVADGSGGCSLPPEGQDRLRLPVTTGPNGTFSSKLRPGHRKLQNPEACADTGLRVSTETPGPAEPRALPGTPPGPAFLSVLSPQPRRTAPTTDG